MNYNAIKNSINGNPVLLYRELLKYDKETLTSILFQYNGGNSAIKEFTLKNKNSYYNNNSSNVTDFLSFIFELDYNPMRLINYNPYLEEWGKKNKNYTETYTETYPEITSLWFDLSDENQYLLLKKTGKENIQNLVLEGYYFLHHAFKNNHYKTIELLNTFDLDYSAKDRFGKSVRDYAENNPVSLDLYLKLNSSINSEQKFNGLKNWFVNNIQQISTSKHYKPEQMQKITQWLTQKWPDFTLEQKQEIFSLSIGSTTKDVFSFISQLVEDKKTLLSPKYPFWMSLDNCKIKQLAFSSLKNVNPTTYNSENDVFFVEKLALMFQQFDLHSAMSQTNPKDDLARIKSFAESYSKYKDMWLEPSLDGDPLFHTIAKRKNEVFKVFGDNWLNIKSKYDLLGQENSSFSSFMEDNIYTVQRHDRQASLVNVTKVKVAPVKINDLEIFKKTWLHKDKNDKYTFEYFLENHYESISYNLQIKPKILVYLNDLMKDYHSFQENKTLSEKQKIDLNNEYKNIIEPIYPIEVVFKLFVSCFKIYDKMTGYNIYNLDSKQISNTIRNCYNILSLNEYKNNFDISCVEHSQKIKLVDYALDNELNSIKLNSKLNRDLSSKETIHKMKI